MQELVREVTRLYRDFVQLCRQYPDPLSIEASRVMAYDQAGVASYFVVTSFDEGERSVERGPTELMVAGWMEGNRYILVQPEMTNPDQLSSICRRVGLRVPEYVDEERSWNSMEMRYYLSSAGSGVRRVELTTLGHQEWVVKVGLLQGWDVELLRYMCQERKVA